MAPHLRRLPPDGSSECGDVAAAQSGTLASTSTRRPAVVVHRSAVRRITRPVAGPRLAAWLCDLAAHRGARSAARCAAPGSSSLLLPQQALIPLRSHAVHGMRWLDQARRCRPPPAALSPAAPPERVTAAPRWCRHPMPTTTANHHAPRERPLVPAHVDRIRCGARPTSACHSLARQPTAALAAPPLSPTTRHTRISPHAAPPHPHHTDKPPRPSRRVELPARRLRAHPLTHDQQVSSYAG
jgi:hypothetical protein